MFTPEDYVPLFKIWNINLVGRLNKPVYDNEKFIKNKIKHIDLYFLDGSTPSEVIDTFLSAAEKEKEALAVHCKAGLGRTGTLIGLYAMKHFKFPATAFICYIRICRPWKYIRTPTTVFVSRRGEVLGERRCVSIEKWIMMNYV